MRRKARDSPIVQTGHPVLRRVAEPVDLNHIGTPEFEELIDFMIEAMRTAPGVGVAAPQIGIPLRVFVLEDSWGGSDAEDEATRERPLVPLHVVINPTLESVGDEVVHFYEGCLSVTGMAAVVPRHRQVRVKAIDRNGEPIELDWQGWPARMLQHELDHLEGALYIDRMITQSFTTVANLEIDDEDDKEQTEF